MIDGESSDMKSLIEGAFPLRMINQSAMAERVHKDHPGNMHLWWNRSPIDSSRELMKAIMTTEKESSHSESEVTVVDPFSGFGGLILATAETGLPIVAGDLNSIAVVLTKAATEIPARFADQPAVSHEAENRIYTGVDGLAEDIFRYGEAIRNELSYRLAELYPDSVEYNEENKKVYSWIWTRTATCPNPACGCKMPLVSSYVLSRQKDREYYVQPTLNDKKVSFRVIKGIDALAQQGNKIGSSGAKFKCPSCGEITTDDYVKSKGRKNEIGIQLMAVGYEGPEGREYITPTDEHLNASSLSVPSELPVGEIPNNTRWFSPPLFGMKNYSDLYLPRQLVLLTTLCELVNDIKDKVYSDARDAGFAEDNISLAKGGSGALAYSEAVSVYLTLVVDKLANFQSEFCTWDNRKGNIRATFTRQAIPMTWTFAEGNPFSSITGNYDTMLRDVVRAVRSLPYKKSATVIQGEGTRFDFPKDSILFTELPYYDNVGYADLSDYFYVWMRRCLRDVYPELFEKVVTSKEELTSIPEHYDGNMKIAKSSYEEGIRRLCLNFAERASTDYPSIIFYEFAKTDEQAMRAENSEIQNMTAWENLLDALIQAGFRITAVLPVRTEVPNERFETIRVCVVFRKKKEDVAQITRRGFINELKKALPAILEERFQVEIDDWDKPITGMGCGLSFFSRYKKVVNADGTNMNVHDALQVIWAGVNEHIKESEVEKDNSEIGEDSHAGKL